MQQPDWVFYLAKALPLKVPIQARNKDLLVVMISCLRAEFQQVREELGFIDGNDLNAAVAWAYS